MVMCKYLFFFFFLDFEHFLEKKCPPTERAADRGISRPAGRERLADRRFSAVITFWTLKIFGKKCPTERAADRGISRPAGRERLADRRFSAVITFWTLKIFGKKCPTERAADGGISRPAGRERLADRGFFPSDRREHSPGLGIFYRDRLFREEVTLQWKKRPVEGLFGRARSRSICGRGICRWDHLLDFENISKSVVKRDPPMGVSLDRRVENDSPMADLPA